MLLWREWLQQNKYCQALTVPSAVRIEVSGHLRRLVICRVARAVVCPGAVACPSVGARAGLRARVCQGRPAAVLRQAARLRAHKGLRLRAASAKDALRLRCVSLHTRSRFPSRRAAYKALVPCCIARGCARA